MTIVGLLLVLCLLHGALWLLFRRKIEAIGSLTVENSVERAIFRRFPAVAIAHAAIVALLILCTFLFLW
jgi:hypothetical protein